MGRSESFGLCDLHLEVQLTLETAPALDQVAGEPAVKDVRVYST